MNPYGSYRALLDHSASAMLAAIEIYNKPQFAYRSECFVILLLNAWELALKALLSKNRIRIYEPKERGKPYITLRLWDTLKFSKGFFPEGIDHRAVSANIERLNDYRNNAIHFYNEKGFEVVIYGLAQTSIVNFRDLVSSAFGRDIAAEVNITLLPLSFSTAPDPISYLGTFGTAARKPAIAEFLKKISDATTDLEAKGVDTARFLTVFSVSLQSTKKITSADLVAGVAEKSPSGMLLVSRKVDPNVSHPYPRKRILELVGGDIHGHKFTSRTFDSLIWQYKVKKNEQLCWHNTNTNSYQYAAHLVQQLCSYTKEQIAAACKAYTEHLRKRSTG
jgi:hypothetical protein